MVLDDMLDSESGKPEADFHFVYDVFVSYSAPDREWVRNELLPRLSSIQARLITVDSFEIGAPVVTEVERAVVSSRKTLLILTPAYLQDQWAEFGSIMVHALDPASRSRRFIPIIKAPCDLPLRLRGIVAIDCTGETDWERLINVVRIPLPLPQPPDASRLPDQRPPLLPIPPTPFIGRSNEVTTLRILLTRPSVRLVTLTGSPGIGKTRIALRVASELRDRFPDGVYFVPLGALTDSKLIASAIAQVLSVQENADEGLSMRLQHYLRDKHALLILDNFEQVMDAAPLVGQLLANTPRLKILVTSRIPLRLYGEYAYTIPPLSLPTMQRKVSVDALLEYEAIQLFVERVRAVKPDFTLTRENAGTISEICYRVDGLPLAIELAAARMKLFTPQVLLTRMSRRLHVLAAGPQDLPARQQTLRNAISWSYDLLPPEEQILFRRLGVFVGGCSPDAVTTVCSISRDLSKDPMASLEALLDHSLLRQDLSTVDDLRFRMLDVIREYAWEQLVQQGEENLLREQHARYFLSVVEEAETNVRRLPQQDWLDRLEQELDNLRAALAWCQTTEVGAEIGLRLAGTLWWFWYLRGYISEGLEWLERVVARSSGISRTRASALLGTARLMQQQYNYVQAEALCEESLAMYRQIGDHKGVAASLRFYARGARDQGNFKYAMERFKESIDICWNIGDKRSCAYALNSMGELFRLQGDYQQAAASYAEAHTLSREVGDTWHAALVQGNQAYVALAEGDLINAVRLFQESLGLHNQFGDRQRMAVCFVGLAAIHNMKGQSERATLLFGAAHRLLEVTGAHMDVVDRIEYDRHLADVRAHLDKTVFKAHWEEGQNMSLEQVVASALGISGSEQELT